MQVKSVNEFLTEERLINSRWIWSNQFAEVFSKSFYFGKDGLIKIYKCSNERSWTLEDGILRIFDDNGELFWVFDVVFYSDDRLAIVGRCQKLSNFPWFCLKEHKKQNGFQQEEIDIAAESLSDSDKEEGIRLVIWDLDETFWSGTLTEGGISPIQEHIDVVETLNQRGIVNAICSKNHFDEAKNALSELGIWDSFVFPEISFSPKGAMIKNIIKNSQLRPETILFIDDNKMNLNEALHYIPKIKIAEPNIIKSLLNDPKFVGKPDPKKSRLAKYKILETKLIEKSSAGGDNEQFLRNSQIRISFHSDIENEFPRIHDLVNRTNQLNFTKNRWPENIDEAREQFLREQEIFGTHSGYVKVSDRYGNYGIVGFYSFAFEECSHFLFSCRTMNMGVEQFVWEKIGKPFVATRDDIVSDIDMSVDWIIIVDDVDNSNFAMINKNAPTICIRGACDLMVTSQFLRTKANTIEEFAYPYQGWGICSVPRAISLYDEVKLIENQIILNKLPGFPTNRFDSAIIDGGADIYVLSFSQESFCGQYRSKSTGMILPLQHLAIFPYNYEKPDYTKITYDDLQALNVKGISKEQWDFLHSEFEFLGGFDPVLFEFDVRKTLTIIKNQNKPVIILGVNDKIGRDAYLINFFGRINQIVRPIAAEFECDYIDITQFIHSEDDLAKDELLGGAHFSRNVYAKIADEIFNLLPFSADNKNLEPETIAA